MLKQFEIGLSSWIIQDGNYGDFVVGQKRLFALEFLPHKTQRSNERIKRVHYIKECRYQVNAEIIFGNKEVWILDFGISAYQEASIPDGYKIGDYLSLELFLGIDPFFYFESLSKTKGIPPIIYEWCVEGIKIETAPFIETENEFGRKLMVRDETKFGWKEIHETDAWKDDNGNGEYVLVCKKNGNKAWNELPIEK